MDLPTSIFLLVATILITGGSFGVIYYLQNPGQLPFNQEEIDLNEQTCVDNGGRWNSCGNKCQILNAGNPGVFCTQVCEEICECGTIAGLTCPSGYTCRLPSGISDAQGFCKNE